jgi:hypothetical protein
VFPSRTDRAKERGQRAHGAAQTRVPAPSHPRIPATATNVTVPTTSRWEDRIEVVSRPGRSYSSTSTVMTLMRPKPRGRAVKRLPRPTGPSVALQGPSAAPRRPGRPVRVPDRARRVRPHARRWSSARKLGGGRRQFTSTSCRCLPASNRPWAIQGGGAPVRWLPAPTRSRFTGVVALPRDGPRRIAAHPRDPAAPYRPVAESEEPGRPATPSLLLSPGEPSDNRGCLRDRSARSAGG